MQLDGKMHRCPGSSLRLRRLGAWASVGFCESILFHNKFVKGCIYEFVAIHILKI